MPSVIAFFAAVLVALYPGVARAEFPDLNTQLVIPGCKIARTMDGTLESLAAASVVFTKDPRLAMGAAYCAGWASEAFDRYADEPHCFTNDMSVDDLILVVIQYVDQHPEYQSWAFITIAESAISEKWPGCREHNIGAPGSSK